MDINKMLENIVYVHLRSAGYEVMVGKMGKREEVAGGSYQGIQHLHIEDFLISITGTTE